MDVLEKADKLFFILCLIGSAQRGRGVCLAIEQASIIVRQATLLSQAVLLPRRREGAPFSPFCSEGSIGGCRENPTLSISQTVWKHTQALPTFD